MTEPGLPDNSDDTAFEEILKEEKEEPEEAEIVTWSSILPPSSADS